MYSQLCVIACFLSELHFLKIAFSFITISKRVWGNENALSLNQLVD